MSARADIAIIGGSGLYALDHDSQRSDEQIVDTPFGATSDPITLATVGPHRVAFLPRHGRDHRFPPHRVPYRANLWALRMLGVRHVLGPCAVGGLRAELGPGTFVLPDQLIDRTSGREQTYFDEGAVHIGFADPYCPTGRGRVASAANELGIPIVERATMVVIEGPRFSTRAESRSYAQMGAEIINMTGHPEAVLARELGMCYTAIALVTDLDAGVEGERGVTQEEVFRVFGENIARLRTLLLTVAADLPVEEDCACRHALDGIVLPKQPVVPA